MSQTETNLPAVVQAQRVSDMQRQVQISSAGGGLTFTNMEEVITFGKIMAQSDKAVPPHLRGNTGACIAVVLQAVEWRMSPYAVANKSYVVNDRISYESQLIHAVVEQRAPLEGRLRCRYVGEGDSRQCVVWGRVKGEADPFEYTSSKFKDITPKNSPLWKTKPDLQLFYNASRDWARMYFPDVILGVYADDEFEPERPAQTPVADAIKNLPRANAGDVPMFIEQQQHTPAAHEDGAGEEQSGGGSPAADPTGTAAEQSAGPAPSPAPSAAPARPQQMPDPCDSAWIEGWCAAEAPAGMSVEEAATRVGAYLRLHLKKPWNKLKRDEQQRLFDEWLNLGFPLWRKPETLA